MDHRRQNRLRHRQKMLVRGPGVTCTQILCKGGNLEGSAVLLTVSALPAAAKSREQGNQVHLPGGFEMFLTLSLWVPRKIFASLAQKVKQPQVVTKQNKLTAQESQG